MGRPFLSSFLFRILVQTYDTPFTKERMQLANYNSLDLFEGCESYVAGHREQLLDEDLKKHLQNHSTLYKYLCVEISNACIGVTQEKDKFKPGDVKPEDLTHEGLAKMLKV